MRAPFPAPSTRLAPTLVPSGKGRWPAVACGLAWLGLWAAGCVLPWAARSPGDSRGRFLRPGRLPIGAALESAPRLRRRNPGVPVAPSRHDRALERNGGVVERPTGGRRRSGDRCVAGARGGRGSRGVGSGPGTGYRMGDWSPGEGGQPPRTSRRGQKDAVATVKTDILVLREPAREARLRVTLYGDLARHPERVRAGDGLVLRHHPAPGTASAPHGGLGTPPGGARALADRLSGRRGVVQSRPRCRWCWRGGRGGCSGRNWTGTCRRWFAGC